MSKVEKSHIEYSLVKRMGLLLLSCSFFALFVSICVVFSLLLSSCSLLVWVFVFFLFL